MKLEEDNTGFLVMVPMIILGDEPGLLGLQGLILSVTLVRALWMLRSSPPTPQLPKNLYNITVLH